MNQAIHPASRAPWVQALAEACLRTSQRAVAERLRQPDGYPSDAVVNQVLRGRYTGRTERIQALVEGAYLGIEVDCPVLGALPLDRCVEHQTRPFSATNPQRVRLYRACRGCANALPKKEV